MSSPSSSPTTSLESSAHGSSSYYKHPGFSARLRDYTRRLSSSLFDGSAADLEDLEDSHHSDVGVVSLWLRSAVAYPAEYSVPLNFFRAATKHYASYRKQLENPSSHPLFNIGPQYRPRTAYPGLSKSPGFPQLFGSGDDTSDEDDGPSYDHDEEDDEEERWPMSGSDGGVRVDRRHNTEERRRSLYDGESHHDIAGDKARPESRRKGRPCRSQSLPPTSVLPPPMAALPNDAVGERMRRQKARRDSLNWGESWDDLAGEKTRPEMRLRHTDPRCRADPHAGSESRGSEPSGADDDVMLPLPDDEEATRTQRERIARQLARQASLNYGEDLESLSGGKARPESSRRRSECPSRGGGRARTQSLPPSSSADLVGAIGNGGESNRAGEWKSWRKTSKQQERRASLNYGDTANDLTGGKARPESRRLSRPLGGQRRSPSAEARSGWNSAVPRPQSTPTPPQSPTRLPLPDASSAWTNSRQAKIARQLARQESLNYGESREDLASKERPESTRRSTLRCTPPRGKALADAAKTGSPTGGVVGWLLGRPEPKEAPAQPQPPSLPSRSKREKIARQLARQESLVSDAQPEPTEATEPTPWPSLAHARSQLVLSPALNDTIAPVDRTMVRAWRTCRVARPGRRRTCVTRLACATRARCLGCTPRRSSSRCRRRRSSARGARAPCWAASLFSASLGASRRSQRSRRRVRRR